MDLLLKASWLRGLPLWETQFGSYSFTPNSIFFGTPLAVRQLVDLTGNMLQSAFHGNAKKQSGNVTDYNEIGEFSYLGWRGKKKVSVSLFVGTAVILRSKFACLKQKRSRKLHISQMCSDSRQLTAVCPSASNNIVSKRWEKHLGYHTSNKRISWTYHFTSMELAKPVVTYIYNLLEQQSPSLIRHTLMKIVWCFVFARSIL